MWQQIKQSRGTYLAGGLTFGLLAGVAFGVVLGLAVARSDSDGGESLFPVRPLHALASHGTDNVTLATVPVDKDLEAIVVLDHLTGELTGYVLNPTSLKYFVAYNYKNVASDLKTPRGGKPKYSMVAGLAEFRQQAGGGRLGSGVIYITEENSGLVASYGLPWDPSAKATGASVTSTFQPLDIQRARTITKRGGGTVKGG